MSVESFCEPCTSDNKQSSAKYWCVECDEALCCQCTKHHKLSKATKTHHLMDFTQKSSCPSDITSLKCVQHPGKQLEYFCTDHDAICCRDCLAKTHKLCDKTVSLDTAAEHVKQSEVFTDCKERLCAYLKSIDSILKNRDKNLNDIQTTGKTIMAEIKSIQGKLIQRINEIAKNMIRNINTIIEDNSKHLQSENDQVLNLRQSAELYRKDITFVKENVPDKPSFIFIRKMSDNISKIEENLQNRLQKFEDVWIEFRESDEVAKVESLGNVTVKRQPSSVSFHPEKQRQAQTLLVQTTCQTFELETKIDVSGKTITGMAITDDNMLLLCDHGCYKVFVYNEMNQYISSVNMSSSPWDITVIPKNSTAVVTFNTKYIQFIYVKSLSAGKQITITTDSESVYAITSTSDNIMVGGTGTIYILDIEGNTLSVINVQIESIIYMNYLETRRQFYCTDDKSICCIRQDGTEAFTFSSKNETAYRSITTDNHENVYIVERNTGNIQRFHPDGTVDRVILTKNCGIKDPLALCFNKTFDKLYISNYGNQEILIFNCK
ncbi:uncharacterized protein LOC143085382 [Mytilus galloprovincialis]|uniref:uncharacterized protein LOC143085382 n=1 Tax=Mytilus galloprovincialis TaxID=29158 RepID=UPI003F7C123A